MEGWLDTDATGKQKKWVKSHKRWFVLRVGSLYMYSSDKSADAGKHLSVIPLRMCNVRAPKSKRKEQPYAFRIDVTSWKRCARARCWCAGASRFHSSMPLEWKANQFRN
jgi:hypothetical protein